MPRCRDGLGVVPQGPERASTQAGGKPTPPVRFSVCKVISDLQTMVGYVDKFFECFGCVNELQVQGIWFSECASCRGAEPQCDQKANKELGCILWKAVYRNDNRCSLGDRYPNA